MTIKLSQGQSVNFTEEKWNIEFMSTADCKDKQLLSLKNRSKQIVDIYTKNSTIYVCVFFDEKETPVILTGEIPYEGSDVLICNTQNRIALYINKKISDEDWPLSRVLTENVFCDVCNHCENVMIHDDFSVNNQCLADRNYPTIHDIRGWVPEGHNTAVGDCMPFFHNGVYHLFYLFDRRSHQSKWGLGAHQWAHMSTTDFKSFRQYPMAISIDDQSEGSICTGSIIFFNNCYYAFYAVRQCDHAPAIISYAISDDCISFKKTNVSFVLTAPYHALSARDPMVFVDENNTVNMLITTSMIGENGEKKGCLARLTSKDLLSWTQETPFVVLDIEDQPECSDYFSWDGYYYLIYSNFGYAKYFVSKNPYGPWTAPEKNEICADMRLRVPKTAAFNNGRRIAAGFVTVPRHGDYGGELCFMEIIQNRDGSLQFVVPKEIAGR